MRDHLEYYKNLDVEPFVQAVEKLFNANKELGLDAFKSSLTPPGLTLQLMFSDLQPSVYFTLINQLNSDLHQLIKKNVCGGLSVVFHREHQANVSYIRHREFGENAKLCKKILGYDVNSLYLGALQRAMPTGHFIRYQSEKDFKPSICHQTGLLAMQWLEWVAADKRFQILHKYNDGEVRNCESVLDSCRWMVIAQRARAFFNFTATATTATIAPTTPTKRPVQLKKDLATEKPQTCKRKHKKNQRICADVSRTWWRFTSASGCTTTRPAPRNRSLSMG